MKEERRKTRSIGTQDTEYLGKTLWKCIPSLSSGFGFDSQFEQNVSVIILEISRSLVKIINIGTSHYQFTSNCVRYFLGYRAQRVAVRLFYTRYVT